MEIGRLVPEKKIFEEFYHIWTWRPYWSCDSDAANKLPFPLHTQNLALIGQAVSEKIFEHCERRWTTTTDGRRTDAGAWVYYKLTFGSGELIYVNCINDIFLIFEMSMKFNPAFLAHLSR